MRTWERSIERLVSLVKAPLDAEQEQVDAKADHLIPVRDHTRRRVSHGRSMHRQTDVQSAEEPIENKADPDNRFWQQYSQTSIDQEPELEEGQHHENRHRIVPSSSLTGRS